MKKILFIIVVFIVSCKSEEKLSGVWIGPYEISSDSIRFNIAAQRAMAFYDDKVLLFDSSFSMDSIIEYKNGYRELMSEIDFLNSDNLIIEENENLSLVYKRIGKSLKSKSRFNYVGNEYQLIDNRINELININFENDSIIKFIHGSSSDTSSYKRKYRRIDFEGYDLIFWNFPLELPWILNAKNMDTINVTVIHKKLNEFSLIKQ
jgi:hypothetical protein